MQLHSADMRAYCRGIRLRPDSGVNKQDLIKKIVAHLAGGLELYYHAARAARDEATHEQNKAENKYDTRGLEASYLARGQSRQAAETEKDIQQFEALVVRKFAPQEPVGLGALVELESKDGRSFYFIGPRAGGTEIIHDRQEVMAIFNFLPSSWAQTNAERGYPEPQPGRERSVEHGRNQLVLLIQL
jgi:hypothetical protein